MNNSPGYVLLALVVGLAVMIFGGAWGMMLAYGALYSYGVIVSTVSFSQSIIIYLITMGVFVPFYMVGSSILRGVSD